ncbi:hypothetical protein ABFA07_006816 [Porites harrisoni]
MKGFLIFVLLEVFELLYAQKVYDYLGCWKYVTSNDSKFLPKIILSPAKNHVSAVHDCALAARSRGIPVFGIRNSSECLGSVHAALTYMRYGPSNECYNGTGGPTAMDVYSLEGNEHHLRVNEEQEKRNFIYDLYSSTYAIKKNDFAQNIPSNAARHPLVKGGHVRPVMLQPLFKEIDERDFGAYRPPVSGTNILTNPSFEDPLINDPVKGWSCQGETDDPRGGVIARYTQEYPKQGQYSGICLARLSEWAGPGQYVGNRVLPGRVYKFEGWTKLLDRKRTGDIHSLELWLRYKKRGDKEQKNKLLAKRTKYSQDYGWVRWQTAFEIPLARAGFQFVFIYFKGPKPTVDILLDDLYLEEILQPSDWKRNSDILINKYRKRNIQFRVNITGSRYTSDLLPKLKIKVKQKSHLFAFGAALNSNFLLHKPEYRDFYLKNFQWAVLESSLKWGYVEPKLGHISYDIADKAVDFLQANNKMIRGHCVFWAVDTEVPFWAKKLPNDKLKKKMKERLQTLLFRYRGRFMQWDVNNEMLHGSFFADREGLAIRDWMYLTAASVDPGVDLFVNDFDAVENGQLTQAFLEEVQDLLSRGIPLDGIGVQGHFTGHVNPTLLQYYLNMLSKAKIPIWMTEVDVLEKNPFKRADALETVMRTAFSNPSVQGLILWSFWSQSSWRGPYTSLVDGNDWQINAAGLRYRRLLHQWTTHVTLSPTFTDQTIAFFEARGFFGDYEVTLQLPNGLNSTQTFTLSPGSTPVAITLHLPDPSPAQDKEQLGLKRQDTPLIGEDPRVLASISHGGEDTDDSQYESEEEQDNEFPQSEDNDSPEFADPLKSSAGLYIGCFDNTESLTQLKYRYEGHPAMVPDVCINHCASKAFPFAGLLMASECFCGAYFNDDAEVDNEHCKLPCQELSSSPAQNFTDKRQKGVF